MIRHRIATSYRIAMHTKEEKKKKKSNVISKPTLNLKEIQILMMIVCANWNRSTENSNNKSTTNLNVTVKAEVKEGEREKSNNSRIGKSSSGSCVIFRSIGCFVLEWCMRLRIIVIVRFYTFLWLSLCLCLLAAAHCIHTNGPMAVWTTCYAKRPLDKTNENDQTNERKKKQQQQPQHT